MTRTDETARKLILSHRLKRYIYFNTDFGQSRDKRFFESTNYDLLAQVSSVHLPCCVHDGDPAELMQLIAKAKEYNCSIGAHIGYPDPEHTGYEPMTLTAEELTAWTLLQLGAMQALLKANGLEVQHVRPHGALYTKFIEDAETAVTVAKAIKRMFPWAILVAPAGPVLDVVAERVSLPMAPEAYLGKRYTAEGKLSMNHLHEHLPPQGTLEQARQLINDSAVTTADGQTAKLNFKTLHISPAQEGAVNIAEKVVQLLGQPVALPLVDAGASGWL